MSGPENRHYERKLIRCQAFIQAYATCPGSTMRGRTVDASLGGVCVLVPENVNLGTVCAFGMEPLVRGKPVRITATAKVAYCVLSGADGFRLGLQFVHVDDANKKLLQELLDQ